MYPVVIKCVKNVLETVNSLRKSQKTHTMDLPFIISFKLIENWRTRLEKITAAVIKHGGKDTWRKILSTILQ